MDALEFLERSAKSKRLSIYALFGDEDFLKRQAREAILARVLGSNDRDFAVSPYSGETVDFSTIRNELDTLPFVGSARVVVVENADTFVSSHRASLEKYAAKPSKIGVLILELKTFPESTNFAKLLTAAAKIACKSPTLEQLPNWCIGWAKESCNKSLEESTAEMLVHRVGPHIGLLAQEIAKLGVAVGETPNITPEVVDALVSRNREANVFHILEAIGHSQPAAALKLLDELFEDGTEALSIVGALSYTLRKLAIMGRSLAEGRTLYAAMDDAKIPTWPTARKNFELQAKFLGRRRLDRLLEWVLEINLGLRGGSELPLRLQVERLIVKLARPRD